MVGMMRSIELEAFWPAVFESGFQVLFLPGSLEDASLSLEMTAMKHGVMMKGLNFREKKKIRDRLLAIHKESGKVTERELLRLSALTGISYSCVVEVHKSTRYHTRQGLKGFIRRMASSR